MKHTKEINGITYDILNRGWETSRAWGHKSELYANGNFIAETKVRYYNRTWESYRFRSCMQKLVGDLIEDRERTYLRIYKENNGIKRLTADMKREALAKSTNPIRNLKKLYETI